MSDIAVNLEAIRHRIQKAAASAGRDPHGINLLAVSKSKPAPDVHAALKAGHRMFGENRVQEAKSKFEFLRKDYPDIKVHLIGPLQTNKAIEAVTLFDVIETLDRHKLAEALASAIKKSARVPKLYIEINSGQESQKAGIAPNQLEEFLRYCRGTCGLGIEGLMCIPPLNQDPTPHFMRLKGLAIHHGLPALSMGMTGDFETAIHCGATEVRIGTAIFGARDTG